MAYEVKKFPLTGLDGISENQISQHRDILYAGYVNKLGEIRERLKTCDLAKTNQIFSDLRALKADETFALNGVVLHELYFENLSGNPSERRVVGGTPTGDLSNLIARDFGSFGRWQEEFKACGMSARGWVVLGFSTYDCKLHNFCLDTHNFNVPTGVVPILVMDVYEHAYAIDYGVKRQPYIEAFMKNINWTPCAERLNTNVPEKCLMKIAAS